MTRPVAGREICLLFKLHQAAADDIVCRPGIPQIRVRTPGGVSDRVSWVPNLPRVIVV